MMVDMLKRPIEIRSYQCASNGEARLLVLVSHLLLFFCWFLYLFLISCVVGLMRLSDTLVLVRESAIYLVELLQLLGSSTLSTAHSLAVP